MNKKGVILTAYGDDKGKDKGLVFIDESGEKTIVPVAGKANCCIRSGSKLYVPVQEKSENKLYVYQFHHGNCTILNVYTTRYFYSHGFVMENLLILASFESGVDAIVDLDNFEEIYFYKHSRDHDGQAGRSHFIGLTKDNKIYSVDNSLEQIIVYKNADKRLEPVSLTEFGDENIRLMPYSSFSDHFYLNTEKTNSIVAMQYHDGIFDIKHRYEIAAGNGCATGGNAVSADGKRLCVSLRGADRLYYYEIKSDGSLRLIDSISCGAMPRDVSFCNDSVFVTCTNANRVEQYREVDKKLVKITDVTVNAPVTFSI